MRSQIRSLLCIILIALTGCAADPVEKQIVVLTFDDAPIGSEFVRADAPNYTEAVLLAPLHDTLAILAEQNLKGVFFLEGPGSLEAQNKVTAVHAQGIRDIHEAGHFIGYAAYSHHPSIWIDSSDKALFESDLNALESFVGDALAETGLDAKDVMLPLFRQPFGGAGRVKVQKAARGVAQDRGWVYRGFAIDAVDWAGYVWRNDLLVEALPLECDEARVAYSVEQIREGIIRNIDRPIIDVLFHVGGFTNQHLRLFIDTIRTEVAAQGKQAVFQVPAVYLYQRGGYDDTDFSLVEDVGRNGSCGE